MSLVTENPKSNPQSLRGFTLTELAIVLGIMGVILGAIWAAASSAYTAYNVARASKDAIAILANYKSMYATHGIDDPTDWDDITCIGYNAGLFPKDMQQTGTCTSDGASGDYSLTDPRTPIGGYALVQAVQSKNIVDVVFGPMSQNNCIAFAIATLNQPGVVEQYIYNGTKNTAILPPIGTDTPWTNADISSYCSGSSDASFYFVGVGIKAR